MNKNTLKLTLATVAVALFTGLTAHASLDCNTGGSYQTSDCYYQTCGNVDCSYNQSCDNNNYNNNCGPAPKGQTAVPEPSTIVAGALLLLPFGISTVRILRKDKQA
jgi:hypothetical protein